MRMWDAASEGVARGVLHGSCVALQNYYKHTSNTKNINSQKY